MAVLGLHRCIIYRLKDVARASERLERNCCCLFCCMHAVFHGKSEKCVACIILSGSCKSTCVTFMLWPSVSDCTNPLPLTTGRFIASDWHDSISAFVTLSTKLSKCSHLVAAVILTCANKNALLLTRLWWNGRIKHWINNNNCMYHKSVSIYMQWNVFLLEQRIGWWITMPCIVCVVLVVLFAYLFIYLFH